VIFSEYARAAGMPHLPAGTGISRCEAAPNAGCPKLPVKPNEAYSGRVSTNRHGVAATKDSGPVMAASRTSFAAPSTRKYGGAYQFVSGIGSCAHNPDAHTAVTAAA